MCQYIETIRIENGEAKYLNFHQNRMKIVSSHNIYDLISSLALPANSVYKLRIVYDKESIISIDIQQYIPKTIKFLQIVECNDIEYSLKMLDRSDLSLLLTKKNNADEILIIKKGFVCDTSFSNIIFYDRGVWYCPNTYLLNGTCRQRLLKEGRIRERSIARADIHKFTKFMIINAMLDFDEQRALPTSNIIK